MSQTYPKGLTHSEAAEVLEVSKGRVQALKAEGRITVTDGNKLCPISVEYLSDELAAKRVETVSPLRFATRPVEALFAVTALHQWIEDHIPMTDEHRSALLDQVLICESTICTRDAPADAGATLRRER
ncbi:MAG: hypothetical protein AAFS07_11940 [Pseudomonadota bacterium]